MDELAKRYDAVCKVLLDESATVTLLVTDKFEILAARGPVDDVLCMPATELTGRGLASLRPKEAPPHVSPIGPAHLAGRGFWSEVAVGRADGGTRVVSLEVLPLDGNLILLRMSDVTEKLVLQNQLQQMHRQLQQAYRTLEENRKLLEEQRRASSLSLFAAGLAHEINNPVAIAISNLSWIFSAVKDLAAPGQEKLREEIEQALKDAKGALERVASTIKQLRELEEQPNLSRFDFSSWIAGRSFAGEVDLQGPPAVEIETDATMLERTIARLVDNARKASAGTVRIEWSVNGGALSISVVDDGEGMDEDVLERACDPFFTTRPPGSGLGLGLFLAQRAVSLLGGRLELESAPRSGCRATIHLPLRAAEGTGKIPAASYEGFRTKHSM